VRQTSHFEGAESSKLIHYTKDIDPTFRMLETADTQLNIQHVTGSSKSRIIQCIVKQNAPNMLSDILLEESGESAVERGDLHPAADSVPSQGEAPQHSTRAATTDTTSD